MDLEQAYKAANKALTQVREVRDGLHQVLNPESDKIVGYLVRYSETYAEGIGTSQWHGNESDLAIFLIDTEQRREEALAHAKLFVENAAKNRGGEGNKNYEFYEEKPDTIDRLHGIYCAILDTGGSEPEFITWAVFPLLVSNFFPKPSTK